MHSDLDHTIAKEHGGPNTAANLAHLCRKHHRLKHLTGWSVEQLDHGVLRWTSPTGHQYTSEPELRSDPVPSQDRVNRGPNVWSSPSPGPEPEPEPDASACGDKSEPTKRPEPVVEPDRKRKSHPGSDPGTDPPPF
ncbi:HNH endonuclease [Diaminobutyricimonas sp. LJ205]|uniref:HNH endonuclease n=1 Tax=Diaminobutyricimonas sp. LJ205 TaxID=2683590 RepID=UPI00351A075D